MKKQIDLLRSMQTGIKRTILRLCIKGRTQKEISEILEKAQPHISSLLKNLIEHRLIYTEKLEGKVYYFTNVGRMEDIKQKIKNL